MPFRFLITIVMLISTLQLAHAEQAPSGPRTSRGNQFNPDIGLNTLFLYKNSNRGNIEGSETENGLTLDEAELQLTSDVDAYWRFTGLFALHKEDGAYIFEPEEFFAETLHLPGTTVKVGKFKTALGRHNLLHTHAYPFVNAPLIQEHLLGEEGHNDSGVSGSVLVPAPWFMEFTAQALGGTGEGIDYLNSSSPNDTAGVGHLKNLWDLTDATTLEFGLSGATGENANLSVTHIGGLDLTFKWRPTAGGRQRSLTWSSEYLYRQFGNAEGRELSQGFVSYIQYQVRERWWVQARGEYLQMRDIDPANLEPSWPFQRRYSALIGFIPSEFSGLRLQYDHLNDGAENPEHAIMLQANFSIGAHPAHAY